MLTLFALLNAMSIPLICGLGWCTPSAQSDCCCEHKSTEHNQSCPSNDVGCSRSGCPFAHTGACTGLVFLHETDITPAVVVAVELTAPEAPASCPVGFTFDLIRPPTASC